MESEDLPVGRSFGFLLYLNYINNRTLISSNAGTRKNFVKFFHSINPVFMRVFARLSHFATKNFKNFVDEFIES